MLKPFTTSRGTIVIRDATPADAMLFRGLRLEALQESPTAFTADYEKNSNH